MAFKAPIILWRFAFFELWRLVLLTAAVLTTVAAFAATIKPLADGKLGPLDALRFMLLAMPAMLQYALPFAAGFGATLAYHRMTQENEFLAARAAGLSHRSLVLPAAVSGLILAAALALLSGQVIPRFLRSMEEMVTQNLTRLYMSSIRRGECVDMNGAMVYADRIDEIGPDPESGAYNRLLLTRAVAISQDDQERVSYEITARSALVWLHRVVTREGGAEDTATRVTFKIEGSQVASDRRNSGSAGVTWWSYDVPGAFDDDPKFLTAGELRRLPANPDQMSPVYAKRRDLAYRLAEREATEALREALAAEHRMLLTDPDGRLVVVRAAGLGPVEDGAWVLTSIEPGGRIEVELDRTRQGGGLTRLSAGAARLRSDMGKDPSQRSLTLTLHLEDVVSLDPDGNGAAGARAELRFSELAPHDNPLPRLLQLNSRELLAEADTRIHTARPDHAVGQAAYNLRERIERLEREVLSKRHERAAMSVACFVMVLTGALTAMRLGGSLPLTVYLWSFFPALGALLTISAGQQSVHQNGPVGLVMLWGGVAALAAYAGGVFFVLRRH